MAVVSIEFHRTAEALSSGRVVDTPSAMLDPRFLERGSVRTGRIEAGGYARSFLPGDAFFIPAGHPPVLVRTRQAATIVVAHQGLSGEDEK